MNTTYRPTITDRFSYVGTALLAAIVLALAFAVLHGHGGVTDAPQLLPVSAHHATQPGPACFAMPRYPSIELNRSLCAQ